MKVKDVIIYALRIIGRAEIADALTDGATLTQEENEVVNTLVYCYNAVEDEIARRYLPLSASEEVPEVYGYFHFASLMYTPSKIIRVLSNGVSIPYTLFPRYFTADADVVTVEYEYAPEKKTIDSASEYTEGVALSMLAYGTATEYCLINGEIEVAEIWEKKYRQRIDTAQNKTLTGGYIPPRRWV